MKCDFCNKYYSPDYIKYHRRYVCLMNPDRDFHIKRKTILAKIESMKNIPGEYAKGYRDAWEEILYGNSTSSFNSSLYTTS